MTLLLCILALAQTGGDFNTVQADLSPGLWRVTVWQGSDWWQGEVRISEDVRSYTVALSRCKPVRQWGPEWAGREKRWESEFLTDVRGRGSSRRDLGVVR